jgi:threonine dehydratase
MDQASPITRERIIATETAIRCYVRRTPILTTDSSDFGLKPGALTFKLEMLQHSGAFKVRGAFANLLLRKKPAAGVVAASGGNHGAAVAFAARRLGVPATIFLPDITSPAKIELIRQCGANLVIAGSLCRCAGGERSACRKNRRDANTCLRSSRNPARTGNGRAGA